MLNIANEKELDKVVNEIVNLMGEDILETNRHIGGAKYCIKEVLMKYLEVPKESDT